jgi:type IV secretion system protein VirB6
VFSENGIAFYFTGAIFYLAGTIMTVYAAYLILLSKGMLSLLLGFGPIFMGCLIFDVSKRFFDAWLGLIVNYIAVQVLAVATTSFTFVTFQNYLSKMTTDSGLGAALGLLVVALICILIILGVTHVASSLGGGSPVHTGFGNTALAMATGGGWRAASAPFRAGARAGGRAAGKALGTKMRSAAKAATNRFRMNSVRSG